MADRSYATNWDHTLGSRSSAPDAKGPLSAKMVTSIWPLALRRSYESAHPRPDFDEFISQYRKAGGQIDVTIFEEEGEGVLRDLSSQVAEQALEEMGAFINQHLG